jgi:hypothetical protein
VKAAQARRACRESGRRRRNTRQRCDFDAGRARALAVGSDIINDDNWGPYFSTVAGASGAIFALLFVAMQVRIDAWRGEPVRIYAVALALFELAVPLMISLIAVMPGNTSWIGARIAGILGIIAVIGHCVTYGLVRRRGRTLPNGEPVIRLADTLRVVAGSIGSLVLFALLIVSSHCDNIDMAAWICLWLVILGLIESFVFLAHWKNISG